MALLVFVLLIVWRLGVKNAELASENARVANAQAEEKQEMGQLFSNACAKEPEFKSTPVGKLACENSERIAKGPDQVVEEPPKQGERGPGPTEAQVSAAVVSYCESHQCKGADGRTPSPDDVAKAVLAYCTGGTCKGKDGAPAPAVTPEELGIAVATYCADGRCVGPAGLPGPAPTPEEIATAVANYCANGACKGEDGVDGEKGEKGDPPSSITFTNGPMAGYTCTQDPPGSTSYSCSITNPAPEPTPTPEPSNKNDPLVPSA
jgi:hypothetical protein